MKGLTILIVLSLATWCGCADRPERPAAKPDVIVNELPYLEKAAEPFPFPYAEGKDHRNCDFSNDMI